MFGFKSKSQKRKEELAYLQAMTNEVTQGLKMLCDLDINKARNTANIETICARLDELKKDHWDKQAFDALKQFVRTM